MLFKAFYTHAHKCKNILELYYKNIAVLSFLLEILTIPSF